MASTDNLPSPGDSDAWTPEQKQELIAHLDARRNARAVDARLSLPTPVRLLIGTSTAFFVGLTLGGSHGFTTAGLRYRAEHAHRLPKEATGWYLYHKSKNYNMLFGGIKEGMKMGMKVSAWVLLFLGAEEVWDAVRGKKDAVNTVIASATVAGGFSLWSKLVLSFACEGRGWEGRWGEIYGLARAMRSFCEWEGTIGRHLVY